MSPISNPYFFCLLLTHIDRVCAICISRVFLPSVDAFRSCVSVQSDDASMSDVY